MDNLQTKKIILGSASPRRHELLKGLDIDFVIDTKNTFEEIWPEGLPLKEIPEYLSKGKSKGFHRALEQDELLITADTMVLCNDEILGKPKSSEDAKRMLNLLENNKHVVLTGVCIRSTDKIRSFTVSSDVPFGELTDAHDRKSVV